MQHKLNHGYKTITIKLYVAPDKEHNAMTHFSADKNKPSAACWGDDKGSVQ